MASRFAPGTNLKREPPHAAWLYLLAELKPDSVFLIGVPGLGTLRMLAARAGAVSVLPVGRIGEQRREQWSSGLSGVRWIPGDGAAALDEMATRGDVVAVVGAEARRWLANHPSAVEAVRRLIDRGGYAFLEGRDTGASSPERRLARATGSHLDRYRLLPLRGEPRVMVPDTDRRALAHVIQVGAVHPWGSPEQPRLMDRVLRRVPASLALGSRFGSLIARNRPQVAALPDYLEQMAGESGISFAGHRWWLSVPEGYRSRKVVFRLFGPTPAHPSYVVKMVSHPEMNSRLQNEGDALVRLESLGFSRGGRAPRVAFKGEHAGLAIVCQSAIEGRPFREVTGGSMPCAYGRSAAASITELAVMTRTVHDDPRRRALSEMAEYLDEFTKVYGNRLLSERLASPVGALTHHAAGVPRVFLHGDPGTWNMLGTRDGTVAFLDWESADPAGPPLWDLFYFLRSYGVTRLRQQSRSAIAAFEQTFFGNSELSRWTRGVIDHYVEAAGIDRSLLLPLFQTCWMHRALKEATRLERANLAGGHFVRALESSLRNADALSVGGTARPAHGREVAS
jgi:Phosphotransferase enzyme family